MEWHRQFCLSNRNQRNQRIHCITAGAVRAEVVLALWGLTVCCAGWQLRINDWFPWASDFGLHSVYIWNHALENIDMKEWVQVSLSLSMSLSLTRSLHLSPPFSFFLPPSVSPLLFSPSFSLSRARALSLARSLPPPPTVFVSQLFISAWRIFPMNSNLESVSVNRVP